MTSLLRALLSIFYPQICPMCGRYIGGQTDCLCNTCLAALPRTEQAVLRENGTEMALWGEAKNRAAARKTMHLERAAAFLFYEKNHPVQNLIHQMKYAERPEIGYHLAREAAKEFIYSDFFDGIDVIMPVPLHPHRLRSRGYNQSEYIARGLGGITGIPVDTTHLARVKDTPQQALQKGDDRRQNVAEAFAVSHPEQMYHKHILVVDDLITTGETMRACLKTMKAFRGARFSVFALCKAG